MNLNEKLSALRKSKGLTQQEIAEALNVSRQAVSRWEVGTAAPSLDNLACLSRLYGVPLDDFIKDETAEKVPAEIPAEAPSEEPVGAPAAAPSKTGGPYIIPICLFLAVLILGVGILIGVSLRREPEKEVYLYTVPRADADSQITVGWLEQTPADMEAEKQWLESSGQAVGYYSPDTGVLHTLPNDVSEEEHEP